MKNLAKNNRGIQKDCREYNVEILSTTPNLLGPSKGSWAKNRMTPEEASQLYVELEKLYDEVTEELKVTRHGVAKEKLRKRKKDIRTQQNLLYPIMAYTGWVVRTQHELGFKNARQVETLYARYKRMKDRQAKVAENTNKLVQRVMKKEKELGE